MIADLPAVAATCEVTLGSERKFLLCVSLSVGTGSSGSSLSIRVQCDHIGLAGLGTVVRRQRQVKG